MWKFLQTVELLTKVIDISNICVFFINGVFPSLLYRLLDVRTVRYAHYCLYLCVFCQVTLPDSITTLDKLISRHNYFDTDDCFMRIQSYHDDIMINKVMVIITSKFTSLIITLTR